MATRDITDSATPGAVTGDDYMDNTRGHLKVLLDKMHLPVGGVAGTNAYTGTVDPAFDADGLVSGMVFSVQWPNTNTSTTVTLNLNGEGAVNVREFEGSAPAIGALVSGDRAFLEYTGTEFRMVAPTINFIEANLASAGPPTVPTLQVFTSSGTWTKSGDTTRVMIIVTGGGDSGDNTQGGSAAGTAIKILDVTSIASSTITIGTSGGLSRWSDGTNTIEAEGGNGAGTTSGGDLNIPRQAADTGNNIDGVASFWGGNGTVDQSTASIGTVAVGYGSGGGGVGSASGATVAGADGVVFVMEF